MNSSDDLATKDLKKRVTKIVFILLVVILVVGGAIFTALVKNGISLYAISGNSMEPTFSDRDSIVLQQKSTVEKDDIIFFNKPREWDKYAPTGTTLVKRITAVPGDVLEYDGKVFTVNGEEVFDTEESSYECENGERDYSHRLTNKEVFVMGDNALNSLDSRRVFCDGDTEDIFVQFKYVRNYGEVVFEF